MTTAHIERWRRILEYYQNHGVRATTREFGISKARVYQIIDKLRKPRVKPLTAYQRFKAKPYSR